ncbi:uncharacterized protein LOC141611429 isoform X2 [Silene latifolia]
MMLDLDCDPLVTKMLELFQRNISPKHPHAVVLAMVNIMSMMIEESDNVSTELVKVLLTSIRRENQSVSPASWELSAKILEGCTDKLRPYILETVSSMGYCLEDYAPILLSIFNPEPEPKPITVMNVRNDSSFLVNNEPSDNLSHRAPYVQALEAVRNVDYLNACGSGGTVFNKRRKQNSQNLVEEPTDLLLVNDKPSGNPCHPPDYVQALEATESCQIAVIAEAEYVQALEAAECFCVNASETEGTALKEGKESKFQNLDEEAIGLECEHDDHQSTADGDISKNNEIVKKEMDFKSVREEADGFENKQVYDSCGLGANKRKRGRPRKKDVEQQEFSGGSVNKDAFQSNDPFQNQRKQASLDKEVNVMPPGNLSHSAESVQDLKAAESVECVDALSTGGTVSKEGRSLTSQNLDEEVTGLEREQGNQGTADDGISKNIRTLRTDMDCERAKEEAVGVDNKQLYNSSVLGDNKRKRGRPRKKDVKQQEFSGGSGNKSETARSTENDALSTGGTVSKEGMSLKSQNRDEEVTGLECEQVHQGTVDVDINKNITILRTEMDFERVKEEAVDFNNKQLCNSSEQGVSKRKRGRPRKKDVEQQEFSGGSRNKSETGPSTKDKFQSNGCFQNERNHASSDDDVIETPLGRKTYKDLVGCKIKVWWPLDGRYYKGRITLFDASMKKHQVTYDDGDEEILSLRKERWEFI